jgi:hypothetical protein
VPLPVALKAAGARPDDIRYVVICDPQFDPGCGNREPAGRLTYTQRLEPDIARTVDDHTLPWLIDSRGGVRGTGRPRSRCRSHRPGWSGC